MNYHIKFLSNRIKYVGYSGVETATAIDSLWKKVDTVYDAHNLSKIIMYTTRALVMVTTWTMFDWVTRIVNHAISHPETPSWVTSLVTKIGEAIQAHHAENTAAKKSTNSTIAKSRAKASLDQAYFPTYLKCLITISPFHAFNFYLRR